MATVNTCYVAAGCNRCPFSADWGRNGMICYGYSNAVAIYKPEGPCAAGGITATYLGHKGRVNCVTWVSNGHQGETEFVSGSVDSTAILWQFDRHKSCNQPVCTLKGHEGSVICVSACNIPPQNNSTSGTVETLIVTASADSTVRIWSRIDKEVKEQQVLNFGSGFALTVATFIIPGTNVPILACGCDDHKVHLYVPGDDGKFFRVLMLSGHEDWVGSLHFTADNNRDILLASCSQDHLIRVWRLAQRSMSAPCSQRNQSVDDLQLHEDITAKETIIHVKASGQEMSFAVSLESVLCGHDNWVYSVKWHPCQINEDGKPHQPMKLLSASMDKTMIIWSPDADTGVWIEEVRVGDVGGNTLGFFGGLFSPCGQSILGHGYQGAFNQWTLNAESGVWQPQVTGGGHFSSVVDLAWSGDGGHYILSASTDQTTRLHAPWVRKNQQPTWYEIARPQVHGYDLQCLAVLGKYMFASGSDEKLVRVFKAPRNFISNFCQICGHSLNKELDHKECLSLPEGANVPALGLSNKAVYGGGDAVSLDKGEEATKTGLYPENYFTSIDLKAPPSEDQLLQNTLWPEEAKLYGHGYEIFSLAANPERTLLASACKAAKADVANILLWDMDTKKIVASLESFTLTVTQMAFSNQGNRLLAVSRDRTWALFKRSEAGQFVLEASVDKKTTSHARIIWSCAWSHDDQFFFTASRDKKVLVWSVHDVTKAEDQTPAPIASLVLPQSVTAVSLAPVFVQDSRYFIALATEDGQIFLYTWASSESSDKSSEWKLAASLSQSEAHHLTVARLTFRPQTGRLGHSQDSSQWLQLASCGADHAVRVYDIDLLTL